MINLEFLTSFQMATFVLGIVFSILTIAMVFYTLRRPNGYRNTFLKVLFTVILPMVTFIMWFACVFAAYGIFEANELYIMLLAIACGAALSGITALVAWLIHIMLEKRDAEAQDEEEAEETEEVEGEEEAVTEEANAEVKPEAEETAEQAENEAPEAEENEQAPETEENEETAETEEVENVEAEVEAPEAEEVEAEVENENAETEEAEEVETEEVESKEVGTEDVDLDENGDKKGE